MKKKQRIVLARIVATAVLVGLLVAADPQGWVRLAAWLAVWLLISYDIVWRAVRGIVNLRPFDEYFLMAVASAGAFALAVYSGSGDFLEAVAVMLFYQVGEFFQSYAVGRSRRNIAALMDIRPDSANVERDGQLVSVDPAEVAVGTDIFVRPGERVPIDGVVVEGRSSLNTSALTGESLPREVAPGDEVVSGSINMSGLLRVRTVREFGESTVSKILELMEESASRKARSEHFIARFARVYTPAVCAAALLLALVPPLVRLLALGVAPMWGTWVYRALTFLVISCPCALVISIPLGFFAGIGGASRRGILVKGANILEALASVRHVVFDKTGTLTRGVFEVGGVHDGSDGDHPDRDALLELAALAECASSHPISQSLRDAFAQPLDQGRVRDIQEVAGQGVTAVVDGHSVAAGNERLMRGLGLEPTPCHTPGTTIHMAVDGRYAGHIVMGDSPKAESRQAIEDLRRAGVRHTAMLTGDARPIAEHVARQLDIDEVHAQLLPTDKVACLERLLERKQGTERLAFVGDGINDAPVLTRADVGIAMGGIGSDAAIEAADVVIVDDDPRKVALAIRHARRTMGIVRQNIVATLGVKFACLALGAVGVASMWLAIFADVGIMVLAVLNAMRALHVGEK